MRGGEEGERLGDCPEPLQGQGQDHVVGGGEGVGLEKLEYLAEYKTSQPLPVQDLPHQLTSHGEYRDHEVRQGDVKKHCPAPQWSETAPKDPFRRSL